MSGSSPLVDRERQELADLLIRLGPAAPTLCEGWETAHLAAHLVVRERRPDAMVGLGAEVAHLGGPVAAWPHHLEERLRSSTPYAEVVGRLRAGPPAWSPMAWPALARAFNTAEYAIHHEDVRRAQPGWTVRGLSRADQDALWTAATLSARRVRGGVVLRRSDVDGVEKRVGAGGRTVEGEPLDLLLWLSGRREVARVTAG
jgi:uncharacterized protein (TIGR03085 family)